MVKFHFLMFFALACSTIDDKMRALCHPNRFIYHANNTTKERDIMFLPILFNLAASLAFVSLLLSYEIYLNYAPEP